MAKEGPRQWHGFAKPPGDPHGPFTLSTLAGRPLPSRDAALEAIRRMVDEREDAALDALIVLAFRGETDCEDIDLDSLPGLSDDEKAALDAIDIEAIIAKAKG